MAVRYKATSWSKYTDKEVAVFAPILAALADKKKVKDIRSLKEEDVLAEAEKPGSQLRRFLDFDAKRCAARDLLRQCNVMLRSICIVTVRVGKAPTDEPMFVSASNVPRRAEKSFVRRRAHVMRSDALASDPLFNSVLGDQVRRLTSALETLKHWTSAREAPIEVSELIEAVDAALEAYNEAIGMAAAAE